MNSNIYTDSKAKNKFFYIGIFLLFLSIADVFINSFLKFNITFFLPRFISISLPLIIGFTGLYFIRFATRIKYFDFVNKNINTSNFNAFLTLLIIFTIIKIIPPLLNWFIFDATISGDSREACTGSGACWTYIKVWLNRIIYGMYPDEEIWRINLSFIILLILAFVGLIPNKNLKKFLTGYYVIVYPIVAYLLIYYLISGGSFNLVWVETGAWGGLSLNFIVSFFSLIFCFPLGVILALGRRSKLPIIKYLSIGFIEFWRGVPLITVLFMASAMFTLFLPEGMFLDALVRIIIAISLFEAAYVAEVVRGGLQALPRGQYDAAKSLGMGYWKMYIFVILPQALKIVIPGIANTFLALVKDTPLILVVGLLEIVGMLNMAKTNPGWLGFAIEGYVFAAIIFWIICYAMSKYSYSLELKYKTDR